MKARLFTLLILISGIVVGVCMWLSSYPEVVRMFTLTFYVTILLTLTFSITTKLELIKIIFATMIGSMLAIIIAIMIDGFFDPTSHNLLPFEIAIDVYWLLIACLIGVLGGALFRWIKKRKQLRDHRYND